MKISKCSTPFILAFLGLLLYSNILYGPFILDDEDYIVNNSRIQNISTFLKDFSGTRYVGFLSFAINYYFGGLDTFGYHLVNVIIHILNAILVYLLVQITLNIKTIENKSSAILPFAVSLIFLVHPIQTQAVSYITQRFTSLSTLFYLLALALYVKARMKPKTFQPLALSLYILSIFFTALAMKTKEISFTLPFIILFHEITFFNNNSLQARTRLFYLLPFFLTLFIIPLTLIWSTGIDEAALGTDGSEIIRIYQLKDIKDVPVYNYFITQFSVILTYLRLLIIPINQNLWYDYSFSYSILEPATLLSFVSLLSIFSFAIYLYIRSRAAHNTYGLLISLGILWFFITLSVESSIIPIKDAIFEHRVYLPSIGFILSAITAALYGFNYLEKKTKKTLLKYLLLIIIIITVILSFSTYQRNIFWGDKYMMWLDVVKKSPNRPEAHNNLGNIFFEKGRFDKAIEELTIAIKLNSNYTEAYYNLGNVYYNQGMFDEAIKKYLTALKLKPNAADIHYNLGNAYYKQGWFDEAIKEYSRALRIKSNDADIHNNLGFIYYSQDKLDEAMEEYLIALRIKPDHTDAHYNLGLIYKKKGQKDMARKEFEITLKLKPDFREAKKAIELLNNLAP